LILKVVVAAFAFAVYVWIEAVRRTPAVRRRKAQRIRERVSG
jgi:hypothetical protein